MREFVIGDIHGAHIPLKQCLERCGFDKRFDRLYTLGDICDGWPYVFECVEELLSIDTIDVMGNHDEWFWKFLNSGVHPDQWVQGGKGTAKSYLRQLGKEELIARNYIGGYITALLPNDVPASHWGFFAGQKLYHKDSKNRLFIHAGFDRAQPLEVQKVMSPAELYWDRKLITDAITAQRSNQKLRYHEEFSEIFIGHTQVNTLKAVPVKGIIRMVPDNTDPIHADIVWNLDTGAGSNGKLTIMDIDTHEYWQSDNVNSIYGLYMPRG